jgi:hypothetical protein
MYDFICLYKPVFTLSAMKLFKRKHHVGSSCYGKRKVEKKIVDSLQNLVSFILLSLWTHTSSYANVAITTTV